MGEANGNVLRGTMGGAIVGKAKLTDELSPNSDVSSEACDFTLGRTDLASSNSRLSSSVSHSLVRQNGCH